MRRVFSSVTVLLGLIGISLAPGLAASAAPTPGPSGGTGAQAAVPGKKVCEIDDPRLVELSGMVAVKGGYVVINDGSDFSDRKKIFFLDAKCNVSRVKSYSGNGPRDTEDMGVSPDGKTLYIADTGDNDKTRDTVALWTMPVNGSAAPVINRLTYPDGKHDAEALLFSGDGTPIIVTRESGKAGLYSPTGPLKAGTREGVPMKKLGEIKLAKTTTPNWLNALGGLVVTGGATAPDGSRVVLRTYADALEWDVSNGDVVTAVTTGTPRTTPLPEEPRGEAIAYSTDGKSFLTVSETADQPADTLPEILSYTPAAAHAPPPVKAAATEAGGDTRSWFDKLSLDDITYLIAAVGVIGVALVGVGVFGIVRARRKPPEEDGPAIGRQGPPDPGDPLAAPQREAYGGYDDPGWGQRPSGPGEGQQGGRPRTTGGVYGGGVYGTGSAGGGRSGGSVYGGQQSGGVYGSKASGGAVYGGGSSGGGYGGRGHADDGNYSGNGYPDSGYNQGYDEGRTGHYGGSRGRQPDYPDDQYGHR